MIDISTIEAEGLIVIKVGIIIFLALYVLFSLIVMKQVTIMTDTLKVGLEKPIKLFGILHFVASVLSFFISIVIL